MAKGNQKRPKSPSLSKDIIEEKFKPTGDPVADMKRMSQETGNGTFGLYRKSDKEFRRCWDDYVSSLGAYDGIDYREERKELWRPNEFRFHRSAAFVSRDGSAYKKFIIPKLKQWIEDGKYVRESGETVAFEGTIEHEIEEHRNVLKAIDHEEMVRQFDGYDKGNLSYVKRFAATRLLSEGYDSEYVFRYIKLNHCDASEFFSNLVKFERNASETGQQDDGFASKDNELFYKEEECEGSFW